MGNSALAQCCVPSLTQKDEDDGSAIATNRIELAASQLFSVPALATAYHTSIVVNGEEFFFSDSGIFSNRMLASHQGKPSERIEMGYSNKTGSHLLSALRPHFAPGTYDLLRKNCNSFSDCALAFLLRGERLERRFTAMERIGKSNVELLSRVTNGMYQPNTAAESFDIDAAVKQAEEESLKTSNSKEPRPTEPRRPSLFCGTQVNVVGLVNASHLNGSGAVIIRFNAVNGRWEAKLHATGEVKALRAENLRPAGELVLEPGDAVKIHGLASEAGMQLNGCEAVVKAYLHDQTRYEVVLTNGETKALKAENLALEFSN